MNALDDYRSAPVLFADLGTSRLAYRRFGVGPNLLFVHGWPLSGETYRGLVAALQGHFTCIVPDLPGAGETPWDDTIEEVFAGFTHRLLSFVDVLGLTRFGLFGQDSGGTLARLVAARVPDRVYGIGLTNTEVAGHVPPLLPLLQRITALPGAAWVFRHLLRFRPYLRSALGFGGCFKDPARLHGSFDGTALRALRDDPGPAMQVLRRADLDVVMRLDAVQARIEAPMVAVWGDDDPFFPFGQAKQLVQTWPTRSELHRLEGYRLLVHEEVPDEVARRVGPFLLEAAREE